ncbi:MAG: glycosyl hydrolase [Cyanobacteria bacterium P01_A01_bin.15]
MHFSNHRLRLGLAGRAAAIVSALCRRRLIWIVLSLLLTVGGAFVPAQAHRPHDVVTQIKLSPGYSRDRTAYTLVRGNLFKSIDGGDSWRRIVQGLDTLTPFSTLTVAQGQVLALGTHGDGIFRSDSGGENWRRINNGLDTLDIGLVHMRPNTPQVMLAAGAQGGLSRSTDGGQTWNLVADQSFLALTEADGILWAGDKTGQLLRSSDGGQSWQPLLTVATAPVTAIAARGQTVYIGTASQGVFRIEAETLEVSAISQGLDDRRIQDIKLLPEVPGGVIISSWDRGIFISTDRGNTWTNYPQGLVKDKQADEFDTHHFSEIALSDAFAVDKTVFLGGFNGLYKSTQGGQGWQAIETLARGAVVAMDVSPNYASDSTLALTTYVGKIMVSRDRGETWQLTMNGVEVPRLNGSFEPSYQDPRRFFDIAFSPTYGRDQTLFTTGLWTKFLRSTNGARSWSLHALSQEVRGLTLLLSPGFDTDKTLYIGNQAGQLFRSTNGGKRFATVANLPWERGNDSPSMVISPGFVTDRTLYTVADTGVYRSTDAGKTWRSTTENTPIAEASSLHIEISPNYPQDKTLFVSSYEGLFRTTDGGQRWQPVAIANLSPGRTILEGVALSPSYAQDGTVLVSLRGKGLYKSVDGGDTFAPIGDASLAFSRPYNVPCAGRPIQFSPNYANDGTIFGFGTANTDIYRSTDGGETWEILQTPDLEPPVEISAMRRAAIAAELYQGRILKVLLAVVAGIVAFVVTGLLDLDKLLKFNPRLLQFGTAMGSFAVALVVVLKVL